MGVGNDEESVCFRSPVQRQEQAGPPHRYPGPDPWATGARLFLASMRSELNHARPKDCASLATVPATPWPVSSHQTSRFVKAPTPAVKGHQARKRDRGHAKILSTEPPPRSGTWRCSLLRRATSILQLRLRHVGECGHAWRSAVDGRRNPKAARQGQGPEAQQGEQGCHAGQRPVEAILDKGQLGETITAVS